MLGYTPISFGHQDQGETRTFARYQNKTMLSFGILRPINSSFGHWKSKPRYRSMAGH
jgi:hypothetical protein